MGCYAQSVNFMNFMTWHVRFLGPSPTSELSNSIHQPDTNYRKEEEIKDFLMSERQSEKLLKPLQHSK